jgi:hypothetical protein
VDIVWEDCLEVFEDVVRNAQALFAKDADELTIQECRQISGDT